MDFDYVVLPAIILTVGILVIWLSIRRIRSLTTRKYRAWRSISERVAFSAVILLAVVAAGSSTFNAIALQAYRKAHPPQGAFYTVNGRQMYIHCTGSGSPTIVLDSGYGSDSLTWQIVQPELSKTTRVCSFDRAGSGWSDPQPGLRDADQISQQLHDLLHQAQVNGPIVLMGHSIAGLYIRDYATHYPADIAGIVFVDGSSPSQFHNPLFTAEMVKGPTWLLYRATSILGIPRLLWICSLSAPGLDAHAGLVDAEDRFRGHIGALQTDMDSFPQSADETAQTGPYGALPILIFTQDTDKTSAEGEPNIAVAWRQMQEDLKKLSTRSRRIIAKGSGHYIHIDRADLIEKEVPLFIQQIRGTAPQPSNYGSTTPE